MKFNPLEYFVGRQAEIDLFAELLVANENPWVMLVDGLSGTGKSLLVDYLRKNACQGIPNARITLSLSVNTFDIMTSIAEQIHPKVFNQYTQGLERIRSAEDKQPLVSPSTTLEMSAAPTGSIQNSPQSVNLDLGNLAAVIKTDRETRRLGLLLDTLVQHLKSQAWVLFIDETSYLDNPELETFFFQKLFPRLRNNFPRFRLYLTGQSVPTAKFSKHERLEATLEVFQESDTHSLFQKARIGDMELQKKIVNVTLGHPLLTSMLVEHILEYGSQAVKANVKSLEGTLNEEERTQWIYDRILDTIPDPGLRDIAADISLLEWFDLSLLRDIFDYKISVESFNNLVRRSFIKSLVGGRWRCHDIIIKYLRPQRQNLLQDEAREIYRKTFITLQERIAAREEKEGVWNFRERINLTSAALCSLLETSLSEAYDYLLTEIALGLYCDIDYLYPLARFIESQSVPDKLLQEMLQTKQYIEAINLEQYSPEIADYFEWLSQHLYKKGVVSAASEIAQVAALIYSAFDNQDKAIASALRACKYDNSLENQANVAQIYIEAEKFDEAEEQLSNIERQFGDQALLRVARANLAFAQEQRESGLQILFETIARYPQDVDAHKIMMNIMMNDEQYEAVLSQAEAILEVDPGNSEAITMRLEALTCLGRYEEAMLQFREGEIPIAALADSIAPLIGMLNDPRMRGRLLADLLIDPDSLPLNVINVMAYYFSQLGDVSNTEFLISLVGKRFPEGMPLYETYRAWARLKAGQIQEALSLAEPQVKRGDGLPDTYLLLVECYRQQDKLPEAIQMLEELAKRYPSMLDNAEGFIAQTYLTANQADEALTYLEQISQDHELGPYTLATLADVYNSLGRQEEAIQVLEELIFTVGRSELPIQIQIAVRAKYAALLAQRGDNEKAADIAYGLLSLSVDPTLTAPQAASVFFSLQDEEGVRAAYQSTDNWDDNNRTTVLGLLAALIMQRSNNNVEGLLNELAAHPDRLEIVMALDQILTKMGKPESFAEISQQIEEIAPGMILSYYLLQQKIVETAGPVQLEQTKAAITLRPDDPNLYLALGRIQLTMGLFSDAKQTFNQAVRLNPGIENSTLNLQAVALLKAGELELAKELLEPFLSQLPPPLPMVEPLLMYIKATGDRDAEIELLISAAQVYPSLSQLAIEVIADYAIDDGQYEQALEIIDQLPANEEMQQGVALSRITALGEMKRYEEALATVDEMLAKPDQTPQLQSVFWSQRAQICVAAERWGEAENALLKAVELNKDEADLHFALAEVYHQKEEWNMAYEAIMNGLALEPEKLTEYQEELRELADKRDVM